MLNDARILFCESRKCFEERCCYTWSKQADSLEYLFNRISMSSPCIICPWSAHIYCYRARRSQSDVVRYVLAWN